MTERAGRRWEPPDGVVAIDDALVAPLLPARPEDGHKGTFGTLIAICGSLEYTGAALLAGGAALRTGAGLVVLAVPASLQAVVAGRIPELITMGLPESAPFQVDAGAAASAVAERRHTALLVGPGLRPGDATRALVTALLAASPGATGPVPAVVDAEALNSLAATPGWATAVTGPLVLTPHPGELARLEGAEVGADDAERADRARAAAARWGHVVVLKGARTVVAAPGGSAAMIDARNPSLGTGGTGDVLAGTIASLLAQGLTPWDAARLGVHLHATAGAHVRERLGDAGLLASDLLPELPRVRRHLARLAARAAPERRPFGFAMRRGDPEDGSA
ncbi:MAG: NAD(P)H-hydrate dehydratase [Thermoleophilia bacterium]|nr:NAD(P)H-hydrate dehydratase [Thermoleophilia bacterium]